MPNAHATSSHARSEATIACVAALTTDLAPTRSFAGEALNVAEGQDTYLSKMTTPASAACKALGEATETAPWSELYASGKTMFRFSNAWTTDLVEAKTLAMFAYMLKARRVLEVGMFTG